MFPEVMTLVELARELGIHPVTVEAAVDEGLLPRRHANGRAVVLEADVTDEIAAVLVESDAELAMDESVESEEDWDDLDSDDDEDELDEDEFGADDDREMDDRIEDDDRDDESDVDVE